MAAVMRPFSILLGRVMLVVIVTRKHAVCYRLNAAAEGVVVSVVHVQAKVRQAGKRAHGTWNWTRRRCTTWLVGKIRVALIASLFLWDLSNFFQPCMLRSTGEFDEAELSMVSDLALLCNIWPFGSLESTKGVSPFSVLATGEWPPPTTFPSDPPLEGLTIKRLGPCWIWDNDRTKGGPWWWPICEDIKTVKTISFIVKIFPPSIPGEPVAQEFLCYRVLASSFQDGCQWSRKPVGKTIREGSIDRWICRTET